MFSRIQTKIILIPFLILVLSAYVNLVLSRGVFEREYLRVVKNEVAVVGKTLELQLKSLLDLGLPIDDIIGFNAVVGYTEGSRQYLGSVIPVSDIRGKHVCAILLGLPTAIIAERISGATRSSTFISLTSLIISLGLIVLTLSTWVVKPLTRLSKATKDIVARGTDSFQPVSIHSNDEMGRLAASFNTMALQLQKTTVSKAYVDSIITNMTDALAVVDSQSRIQTVNDAASELLEYPVDDLLYQPVNLISDRLEESPFEGDRLVALLHDGELRNCETTYTTRTGRRVSVLLSCSVVRNEDLSVKNIVCTAKDITDLKRAEEALRLQTERLTQSNAQLQQFAYVASHDLQEPLRKVIAFGNRLKEKYGSSLDEHANDYLLRMVSASERMQSLIDGLLEYARISTVKQPFVLVDLNKTARDVLSDLELQVEQTGAKVQVGQLPVVEAEPTQIRRLFQNLILNALKFHLPGVAPVILIYSRSVPADLPAYRNSASVFLQEICFRDNGIGIAKEDSERVFRIFERLHGRGYEGTGIGLAICRKIAEEHGGSIRVQSAPGEGSTFIVTLPEEQPRDPSAS